MGFIAEALKKGHESVFHTRERLQRQMLDLDHQGDKNDELFKQCLEAVRESAEKYHDAVPARKRAYNKMKDLMEKQKDAKDEANKGVSDKASDSGLSL